MSLWELKIDFTEKRLISPQRRREHKDFFSGNFKFSASFATLRLLFSEDSRLEIGEGVFSVWQHKTPWLLLRLNK